MSLLPVLEDEEVRAARDSARGVLAMGHAGLLGTGLLGPDVPMTIRLAVAEECGRAAALELVTGDLPTAAALLGSGETLLQLGARYASERQAFGRPLSRFQVQRHAFAAAAVRLAAARALTWRAAALGDSMDLAAALPEAAEAAWFTAETVLQVHGGGGYAAGEVADRWTEIIRVRAAVQAR
ncbi:MAG TPA: acyl-CoA dehydrogenase family protein [Mycobacteriales bacterium]|jgi:acyl-CoA dehydrogenase|nr:acyl-CoA dehydrogenase family protein [Mycobacteriales bacterium]